MFIKYRKLVLFCLVCAGSFLFISSAYADDATPSVYDVTVTKLELCTGSAGADCLNPVVIGTGSANFDIASAAAGAEVGTYASFNNLPIGTTFSHIRVTLETNIDMQGSAVIAGVGTCSTPSNGTGTPDTPLADVAPGGDMGIATLAVPSPNLGGGFFDAAQYASIGIIHNGATMTLVGELEAPITVTSEMPNVDVAFDVTGALTIYESGVGKCAFVPAAPNISIAIK